MGNADGGEQCFAGQARQPALFCGIVFGLRDALAAPVRCVMMNVVVRQAALSFR